MKTVIIGIILIISALCLTAPRVEAAAYTVTVNLSSVSNDYMTSADYVIANLKVRMDARFRLLPHDTNWYGHGKVFTGSPGAVQGGDYVFYFSQLPDFYQPPPVPTNIASDGTRSFVYYLYSNSLTIAITGAVVDVPWALASYPAEFTNASAFRTSGTNTTTLSPIPTGTYAVTFPLRLKGYAMPAATTIVVSAKRLNYSTNVYLPYSNTLAVTITGLLDNASPSWSLAGPAEFTNAVSYASGFTNIATNAFVVSNIPHGLYTISFPAIVGYFTPATVYTNITGEPLTNSVTAAYVAVTWEGFTNPPPVIPTNFPVQTNDITLMVTTNGLFKTPSREKIIAANGLAAITGFQEYVPTNDAVYLSTLLTMTNYAHVPSSSNWFTYDPVTRMAMGCVTNENTGPQGIPGSNGVDGAVGPQGPPGSNGVQGIQGIQGIQGSNGVQGIQGIQGSNGVVGAMGPQGPAGSNGVAGAQGPQGMQGPAGSNGIAGATGPQGPAGTNGADGAQGPAGSNGVDGAVGPQGPAGSNGVDGVAATIAVAWVSNGVPGSAASVTNLGTESAAQFGFVIPAGSNGIQGATGPQGTQGIQGIQGEVGPQGIQGIQGPPGSNGVDGATGPQGIQGPPGSNGVDGAQGPAGTNGVDGAVGPQGPAGSNGVDGAVGPQGPAGTNGADGAQGPQGPAGTNGVDGAVGPQGPAGPVTNQVITYLGIAYTITNDPASTGDILKFNPTTSNAWFAAETWEGISNSVVYTNSPAKACHTPVALTQTGDTVTITSADSAYQQITLTNSVTFTFDTSFSTNDSCFVNLALYCNNFPVTFDSNTISAATTTNINLATNEWNSLIFHRGCRQAVWSVR